MSTGIKIVSSHYDIIRCIIFLCSFYVPSPRIWSKFNTRKHRLKRNTTFTFPLSVIRLWLFPHGYNKLLKLQARGSTAVKSQGYFNILKTKRNMSSLGLTSRPQLLSRLVKRCLAPVSCLKQSLTQSLPALHAAPSEKHLWTLFDKLIAKWAISWRGFRIASRKPEWLQKENAYRCRAG